MTAPKYTVYSVLGDGNVHHVLATDSALEAVVKVAAQRHKYRSHGRSQHHGIFLTDDPERGDLNDEVMEEELMDDDAERYYSGPVPPGGGAVAGIVLAVLLSGLVLAIWWVIAFLFALGGL